MPKKKAAHSTRSITLEDARKSAENKTSLATSLEKTASAAKVSPVDRLSFALVIANNHYRAHTTADFQASIVESLDEPFEIQNMIFSLNVVEGPWANTASEDALRWLPVTAADLKPLKIVADFVALVFVHLTPHSPV